VKLFAAAIAAFSSILVLAALVCVLAYRSTSDELAQSFGQQLYVESRATGDRLRDRSSLATQALELYSNELKPDTKGLGDAGTLAARAAMFGDPSANFVRLDARGAVVAAGPAPMSAVPSYLIESLHGAPVGGDRNRPLFRHGADGQPYLLMAHDLRGGGAVGVVVPLAPVLAPVLAPASLTALTHMHVLVLDRAAGQVLVATDASLAGQTFEKLFGSESGSLVHMTSAGEAGWETNASWLGAERAQLYLVGIAGLRMGDEDLVVASVAERAPVVDPYLHRPLVWVVVVAGIVLASLAMVAGLFGVVVNSARQERLRGSERQALYEASLALQKAGGLDEVLQQITDQARTVHGANGATIAIIDEMTDEVVFRAVSSADPDVAAKLHGMRLPLGVGVLGWAIEHQEAVLCNDAAKDPRFASEVDKSSGVSTMSLLCAPLIDTAGHSFGAIELVNRLDDPFAESDLPLVRNLGVMAAAAAERAMLLDHEKLQERLQREMDIARTVQQGLLPQSAPALPGWNLAGMNDPAREVGGDFFDYLPLDDGRLGLVIADVADKGLGAAMFMVMCRGLLHTIAKRVASPAKVLVELNEALVELSASDLFVTVFYGVLDPVSGRLDYACAGHNPALLHRAGGETLELVPTKLMGMALGVLPGIKLAEATVELRRGDRLVLYTDGITDAVDPAGGMFGLERFSQTVLEAADSDAAGTVVAVLAAVAAFAGNEPQYDDMTLLTIHAGTGHA
jgi:sigma-B regulation protein RsbU (phosphoserine phosphatase)